MQSADRSILATLAYYEAFGWPLTPLEVWSRQIPSSRFGGHGATDIGVVLTRLQACLTAGSVRTELGLYGPASMSVGIFAERVRKEKECARKWRHLRRRAVFLQAAPFVVSMLASGSLALGNATPLSDWDMLVIASSGRLYTARAFLLASAWMTGRLRTKRHPIAPDRFCFNHWLATDGLALRHRSLFTAHVLASLIPVFDPHRMRLSLWSANAWADSYVRFPDEAAHVRRSVTAVALLALFRRSCERLLSGRFGDRLEASLKRWQQKRIADDPATVAPAGRIVADDQEIEFHPRSFEAVALAHYNRVLVSLDLAKFAESDSGLTK